MLIINDASKTFNALPVLKNISLTLLENTVLGLAGHSGSGKSTLLRCIQGLESLDSGFIQGPAKRGFMFQDFQLFPHLTVLENLTYAPKLHNKAVDHSQEAKQLLANLGIADKLNTYPHQLSGGQKQRVALARSLMMKPSLLLCDEPTSGLDLVSIDEVIKVLNIAKAMGLTMVIASHDLEFLSKIADRMLILKEGQGIADIRPPYNDLKKYYQE
ncbi:amino acid ABC transporter ATP-binding protein [Legionella sp. km772]|uniref:amino acid ABC transporter ATP-binding protein n=1 Tax=Legionella sp. km772 TaxID=2498111 RepID=UPI000F8DE837|nr:ATP-binding cassette domain-containing protein [Legionella sp. km772]RUR13805.1 amino acid ABC transporter ATP-binding protein [Legionella sp. km772]